MTLMAHLGCLCTEHGIYSRLFTAYKKQYATSPASTCFPKLHYWLCLKESAQWARVGLETSNRSHWGGIAGACASAKSLSHTVILKVALKKDYLCHCTPLYMLYPLSLDNFYENLHLKHTKPEKKCIHLQDYTELYSLMECAWETHMC